MLDLDCLAVARAGIGQGTQKGKEWAFLCPFHDDHNPSLMINPEKNAFKCHACGEGGNAWELAARLADCSPDEKKHIAAWLREHGLSNGNRNQTCCNASEPPKVGGEYYGHKISAVYVYADENDKPLYYVCRVEYHNEKGERKKDFPVWADGSWGTKGKNIRLVPYRLSRLRAARTVFHIEGEKDVHTLEALGFTATTSPGGCKAWKPQYADYYAPNQKVCVLADNDAGGRSYAKSVARDLYGKVAAVKLIHFPELPEKGDVTDWLEQGHSKEELLERVKATPPLGQADIDAWVAEAKKDATTEPEPALPVPQWPKLKPEALHGLAGEIVRALDPHTEADPAAVLLQSIVLFGNVIGSGAYFPVEADLHHGNLFLTLVGDTSKARKGTSFNQVRRLFRVIDESWVTNRHVRGVASGEGLVEQVRDETHSDDPKKADPGVTDKRLVVIEAEFARVLKVAERPGCTVSDTLRCAWDADVLQNLARKANGLKATGAHISIVAHITKDELLRLFTETEAANGLGNRFLWACVRRSKALPEGGNLTNADLAPLVERLKQAVQFARHAGEIRRDADARAIWHHVYGPLSEGKPGLLGAMIGRAEPQVVRLSMLYALLDGSPVICRPHLLAALALWQFCEDSARYIFGDSLGDPSADTILAALRAAGAAGMSRTEIRDYFGRNKSAAEIQRALRVLAAQGLAQMERLPAEGQGRPEERWFAVTTLTTETTKG